MPCREAVVVGRRAGGSPPYALHEGARKRGVGDAAPYGWVTSSAVGRDDVGIVPYESVIRTAVKRGVGDAAPYEVLSVNGV